MLYAATWMDLETMILTEVSQRQIPCTITYMQNIKWIQMNYLQNRNRITDIENKFLITKRERWQSGTNWGK